MKWVYNIKVTEKEKIPLDIGVIFTVFDSSKKLPAAIRQRKILASLGAKKTSTIFKNKGKNIMWI